MTVESLIRTDESLATLVQSGDTEAFGELVDRYESKLLRYGRKFLNDHADIQDLVQNIFIQSYQNIQSFDASLRFSPWIYRIAHNTFVNGLKKKKRSPFMLVDFDTFIAHPVYEDPTEREREQEDVKRLIELGLKQISQKYKEILILSFIEEMSYKDIADVLQIPIGTVGVRLIRAKKALREACEKIPQ
jgi:RNA polymerase sigma-70 factor (ECF subfamily)